jgi:hypothetical protein
MGTRAVLDAVKRKIPSPRRESNLRTPIVQPVARRYTDRAIVDLFDKDDDKKFTASFAYIYFTCLQRVLRTANLKDIEHNTLRTVHNRRVRL